MADIANVARAICRVLLNGGDPDQPAVRWNGTECEPQDFPAWRDYLDEARAAIAALRPDTPVPEQGGEDGPMPEPFTPEWIEWQMDRRGRKVKELSEALHAAEALAADQGRRACELFDEAVRAQKAERAAEARIADLMNDQKPMADEAGVITAAEDVLTWLLIEKLSCDDGRSYTPHEAQKIIAAKLDELAILTGTGEPAPAPSSAVPVAWARGVMSPGTPHGPPEYDVEMVWGDDHPEGNGWFPLYREHAPLLCRGEAIEPLSHADLCYLSRRWCEITGLWTAQESRINEWVKEHIVASLSTGTKDEGA